jgi:septum formation inhibitor MinC
MNTPILDTDHMLWGVAIASLDADVQRLKAFIATSPMHADLQAERHAREELELQLEVLLDDQAAALEASLRASQEIQRLEHEANQRRDEIAALRSQLAAARYGVPA